LGIAVRRGRDLVPELLAGHAVLGGETSRQDAGYIWHTPGKWPGMRGHDIGLGPSGPADEVRVDKVAQV